MKCEVMMFIEIIVSPSDAQLHETHDATRQAMAQMGEALADGFYLYKAIPFNTSNVAGIKYILRRSLKHK